MKPVPLVLLLASVLLSSHIRPSACRPRDIPDFDGRGGAFKSQMDEVLLRAVGKDAISYLLGAKLLNYLQRNPRTRSMNAFPQFPFEEGVVTTPRLGLKAALAQLARSLASVDSEERAHVYEVDHPGNSVEEPVELSKRHEDPPISIDLTFHLLRNMIEMAKVEGQREQAELNRKFLDEVGK